MGRKRVGVLFGGRSAEHQVSVLSAQTVVRALDPDRFEPVLIGIDRAGRWLLQPPGGPSKVVEPSASSSSRSLRWDPSGGGGLVVVDESASLPSVDVVFPVLHGPMGEDGTVQGLLELANIPYVGSAVLGSAIGMDKDVAKRLLQNARIPVVDYLCIRKSAFVEDRDRVCARVSELGFPLFVKPANMGSSVGVSRVEEPQDVASAVITAFNFDTKAIVEPRVEGREIECSVLGNDEPIASVPGEIIVSQDRRFYSYDAKYLDEDGAALQIPADLTPEKTKLVQDMAVAAFIALEAQGLARVDFFLRPNEDLLVNEINTMPGFTSISMYPKLWEASGLPIRELVTKLIELAIERHAARRLLKSSLEGE